MYNFVTFVYNFESIQYKFQNEWVCNDQVKSLHYQVIVHSCTSVRVFAILKRRLPWPCKQPMTALRTAIERLRRCRNHCSTCRTAPIDCCTAAWRWIILWNFYVELNSIKVKVKVPAVVRWRVWRLVISRGQSVADERRIRRRIDSVAVGSQQFWFH